VGLKFYLRILNNVLKLTQVNG